MKLIERYLAWLLLIGAGAVLVRDALYWHDMQRFAPENLGTLWTDLASESLRRVHLLVGATFPWAWKAVVEPALNVWAFPVLAVVGFWLLWISRAPPRRRR